MAAVQDVAADEARLAERAIAGDGNAFAELYGRYERRAYNLCLRILGSEDEAADATQDAFVNVLRRLPKLEGRELAFGSYLFTSARHACYDLIERRRRTEPTEEPPEPTNASLGTRRTTPSATCCWRRARRRSAGPTPSCRSASARCWRCGSSRSSRTTRSPRSWT